MELSVISSLYKSEAYLKTFIEKTIATIDQLGISQFEIILIDDGSPDNSAAVVRDLQSSYPGIKLVRLTRNFGHHNAFMAGLKLSKGSRVFNIDCDLETDPQELHTFWTEFDKGEWDVIYGYQEQRKGSWFEKKTGQLFWKSLSVLSSIKIPENITTERLMSRAYVNELTKLEEFGPFLGGMMYWIGFQQKGIPIKRKRREGKSSYKLGHRINLLIDAITSFSGYPLRLVFKIGFFITALSLLGIIYLVGRKILFPETLLLGYTSLITLLLFSLGLIMISMGVIGIYLEKIFLQSKGRPNYIIRSIEE